MEKIKGNGKLNFLFGEIIILKNERENEFFRIIGSQKNDFVLEKINPIIIDDPTVIRTFNKRVA